MAGRAMLFASIVLVLAAATLLAAGIARADAALYYASIVSSALAALALVVGVRRLPSRPPELELLLAPRPVTTAPMIAAPMTTAPMTTAPMNTAPMTTAPMPPSSVPPAPPAASPAVGRVSAGWQARTAGAIYITDQGSGRPEPPVRPA